MQNFAPKAEERRADGSSISSDEEAYVMLEQIEPFHQRILAKR